MFRKQSFWKGSALLLASAMIAKLLGACFKIPLTNVLGGTGMGYFSTAYGLLLPVYALSVTGLSAAVAQTVSRAAALDQLPLDGRPVSQANPLEELYEKRLPLYEKAADLTVDNDQVDRAVDEIIRRLKL